MSGLPSGEEMLREAGMRLTLAKLAILDVLKAASAPIAAGDIFRCLKVQEARMAKLSQNTVYVSLRQLHARGVIMSHAGTERKTLYTLQKSPHGSVCLVCWRCGQASVCSDAELWALARQVGQQHGFDVQGLALSCMTVCPACQARDTRAGRRFTAAVRSRP